MPTVFLRAVLLAMLAWATTLAPSGASDRPPDEAMAVASQDGAGQDADEPEPTLDENFRRRFPQPTRVGGLIGLAILDSSDSTIGYVKDVVRRPDGEVDLIVPYSPWFGWLRSEWGRRNVAVPIKSVGKLAYELIAIEFAREDFDAAPEWKVSEGMPVDRGGTILIALGRR